MTIRGGIAMLAVGAAACVGGTPPDAGAVPDFAADIAPLLSRCTACHREGGIGSFTLRTYGDAWARRTAIAAAVVAGDMPPWHAEAGHREYRHDPSLNAAERLRIAAWAARASAADGVTAATAIPQQAAPGLPQVDVRLRLPQPYTPQRRPDDYRCFVLPWPVTTTTHVTGIDVRPGNAAILHHAIAYLAYPRGATAAEALDAAEAGPGYTCFGGPGQIAPEPYDYGSLGGWVPGYQPLEFPAGTGIRVDPGARVVLQLHYNVGADVAADVTDHTAVFFRTTASVARAGNYIAWLNGLWTLGQGQMAIPAGRWSRHEFVADPYPYFTLFSNVPVAGRQPFDIHSATLHMHQLGVTAAVFVEPATPGAATDMLLRIPAWDFHWQREYAFAAPRRFQPGDKLGVRCDFDNTAAAARDRDWGEGSDDEMCVAFLYTTAAP